VMQITIPTKFYCFMATRILREDVQICQRETRLFYWGGGTTYLRKFDVTCALTETRASFYAHFKANNMLMTFV
jgi:hypothetical protein